MKDLTQGNEGKLIFNFTVPILIGNVFQQLNNVISSIVVGKAINKEALAAVGASFPILFLLIGLIMGATMGYTILIAQFYGAKNFKKVKTTIDTAYLFLFLSSLAITVIGLLTSDALLRLLRTPEDIMPQAKVFLQISFTGMIFMFGYNSISAILRGLGDSKTPLYFLILSTFLNIGLSLLFVLVFKWGIAGSAWASILSQLAAFVLGVWYLNRSHEVLKFSLKGFRFDFDIFKKSLAIGLPSGVQMMLVSIGMMAVTRIVNGFGTNAVAAFTAAGRLDTFAVMPAMNFSAAISTFVGQNLGARKPERVKKGFRTTLLMSCAVSLIISITVILFGRQMIMLFNSDPEVIGIGVNYLAIVGAFYILFTVMFVTNGVLRGAGATFVPMIISVLSLWLIRVPLSALLSAKIGTDGIWWSMPIAWTVGLALTIGYYLSGGWKKKHIVEPPKALSEPVPFEEDESEYNVSKF